MVPRPTPPGSVPTARVDSVAFAPGASSVVRIVRRGRRHPYVGKVFREGLTAIRAEILARDPAALPGATSNHCYFCWYVLTKGVFDRTRDDASDRLGAGGQWEKLSLPLADDRPTGCGSCH